MAVASRMLSHTHVLPLLIYKFSSIAQLYPTLCDPMNTRLPCPSLIYEVTHKMMLAPNHLVCGGSLLVPSHPHSHACSARFLAWESWMSCCIASGLPVLPRPGMHSWLSSTLKNAKLSGYKDIRRVTLCQSLGPTLFWHVFCRVIHF